jgi:hypothetical protein
VWPKRLGEVRSFVICGASSSVAVTNRDESSASGALRRAEDSTQDEAGLLEAAKLFQQWVEPANVGHTSSTGYGPTWVR